MLDMKTSEVAYKLNISISSVKLYANKLEKKKLIKVKRVKEGKYLIRDFKQKDVKVIRDFIRKSSVGRVSKNRTKSTSEGIETNANILAENSYLTKRIDDLMNEKNDLKEQIKYEQKQKEQSNMERAYYFKVIQSAGLLPNPDNTNPANPAKTKVEKTTKKQVKKETKKEGNDIISRFLRWLNN